MGHCGAREKRFWTKNEGLGSPQLGVGLGVEDGKKNMLTKIEIRGKVNDRKRAKGRGA